MKPLLLLLSIVLVGCTPMIDAELRLVDQSRRGVAMVRQSIEARHAETEHAQASERQRLDEAFDADVSANVDQLSTEWVIEAREAYAAAVAALARRDATAARSVQVDLDNLAAIEAALDEIERLNRTQRDFFLQLEQGR